MPHSVILTESAINDLSSIYEYIELNDSISSADYVLDELEKLVFSLDTMPSRGRSVDELAKVGIKFEFIKQISFKPYRVIYRVDIKKVFVLAVVDGRRDLDDLLLSRIMSK